VTQPVHNGRVLMAAPPQQTWTKWINSFLKKGKSPSKLVEDLFEDLRDGVQLMHALAVLCPDDKGVRRHAAATCPRACVAQQPASLVMKQTASTHLHSPCTPPRLDARTWGPRALHRRPSDSAADADHRGSGPCTVPWQLVPAKRNQGMRVTQVENCNKVLNFLQIQKEVRHTLGQRVARMPCPGPNRRPRSSTALLPPSLLSSNPPPRTFEQVKLVNIAGTDIHEGTPHLTLGTGGSVSAHAVSRAASHARLPQSLVSGCGPCCTTEVLAVARACGRVRGRPLRSWPLPGPVAGCAAGRVRGSP